MTSAGTSAYLAVGARREATHRNARRYDIINGPEIQWVWQDIHTDTEPRGTTEREAGGEVVGSGSGDDSGISMLRYT